MVTKVKWDCLTYGYNGIYTDGYAWENLDMGQRTTMQNVARSYLEKKVEKFGAAAVARMLGCSAVQLHYLRTGWKKRGADGTTPVYISLEHLEALARSEGQAPSDVLKAMAIDSMALEILEGASAAVGETDAVVKPR